MTQNISSKVIRNTIFSRIGTFWQIVVTLILTPYIIGHIGIERFGVAKVDESCGQVMFIEERVEVPKSYYAVTGLYIYDSAVFKIIKTLEPSERGELDMKYSVLDGYWSDAETFGSLLGVMVE